MAFWAPVEYVTPEGKELQALGEAFIGRHVIPRYRGYIAVTGHATSRVAQRWRRPARWGRGARSSSKPTATTPSTPCTAPAWASNAWSCSTPVISTCRSTFGRLRTAGFALIATFDYPHFTLVLADLSEVTIARLGRCFDDPIPNPGRPPEG